MRVIYIIVITLLVLTYCSGNAIELEDNYQSMVGNAGYQYNDNVQLGYCNFEVIKLYHKKKFEYRGAILPVGFVKRQAGHHRYSFQAPVTLLMMGIGHFIDKAVNPNAESGYIESPRSVTYMILAPNSSISMKFISQSYLTFQTRTDFLFTKSEGSDRGVLFSPGLGFTVVKDNHLVGRGGITMYVSYSIFWNFDGKSTNDGVGVGISLYGDPVRH